LRSSGEVKTKLENNRGGEKKILRKETGIWHSIQGEKKIVNLSKNCLPKEGTVGAQGHGRGKRTRAQKGNAI